MTLKKTSELMNLGSSIDLADGVPAHLSVSLPLNSLDREVFVVTDIVIDMEALVEPVAAGQDVSLIFSVNKSSTGVLTINQPNAIGTMSRVIKTAAWMTATTVQDNFAPHRSTTGTGSDYLSIIATNDYVLSGSYVTTAGGAPNRAVFVRMTGYRAQASSNVYSALIAEELNSI